MAMSVSKPPITLRSTCTTGPHTQLLFVSKRLRMLYVNTFFTCRYLETYRKMEVNPRVGSGSANASRANVGDALDASRAFGHYGSSSYIDRSGRSVLRLSMDNRHRRKNFTPSDDALPVANGVRSFLGRIGGAGHSRVPRTRSSGGFRETQQCLVDPGDKAKLD